jgi:hypothetical protein
MDPRQFARPSTRKVAKPRTEEDEDKRDVGHTLNLPPCEYEARPHPDYAGNDLTAPPMGAWCRIHGWNCTTVKESSTDESAKRGIPTAIPAAPLALAFPDAPVPAPGTPVKKPPVG